MTRGIDGAHSEPDRGIVRTTETLSQHRLADRLGVGAEAVRAMFRRGLRSRAIAKRKYISGRDFQRYIEEGEADQKGGAA